MAEPRSTDSLKLLRPPVFDDDRKTVTAANNHLLALVLLGVVTPGLVVLALTMPAISRLVWVATAGLDALAILLLLLTALGFVSSAGAVFLFGGWALFTWVAWVSGGVFSASLCAQFLVVALAEATRGWRWSVPASVLAVATVVSFAWAQVQGLVPPSEVVTTPGTYGAVVVACLIVLVIVQTVVAARARASSGRVLDELHERRLAEQRLTDVIDNAPFGAFLCELLHGRRLRVMHANLNASVALGQDASQFVGGDLGNVFAAAADDGLAEHFRRVAIEGDTFDAEEITLYSGGAKRMLEVHAYQTEPGMIAVFFSDVTQKRLAEAEIQRIAFHDELTQLPNRKLLLDRLAVAIEGSRRRESGVALLFIDLDEFKPLNDRFGHAFGDMILSAVGQRLAATARASDTVARIGGDEFTVLITDVTNREQVEVVATKLVAAFQEPFEVGGQAVNLTASIGVALSTEHDVGPHTLLEYADMAMYETKRTGRNGYRVR